MLRLHLILYYTEVQPDTLHRVIKIMSCSFDTFRSLDTIFYREGKQIGGPRKSFDSCGATEPKKGDDGKGHAGNTSTVVGGFGFDVGERRRDAVCAALSLACLKLL